jgi:hypothetical protein
MYSNQTDRFTSDAKARLFKKAPGVGGFLNFLGHCVMENHNGLVVAGYVSQATGRAERNSALRMMLSIRAHTRKLWVQARATTPGISRPTYALTAFRRTLHRTSLPAAAGASSFLAVREPQQSKTPKFGHSERLKRCKPAGTESDQLLEGGRAARQVIFLLTPRHRASAPADDLAGFVRAANIDYRDSEN